MRVFELQSLERRRMLSASFATLGSRGTLSLAGTSKGDAIAVALRHGEIIAKLNSKSQSFPQSAVKRIWIDGFGGDDRAVNETSLPSTLIGAAGDDTLRGGKGNDHFDGGAGADWIQPRDGSSSGGFDLASDVLDYDGAKAGKFELSFSQDQHLEVRRSESTDRFEAINVGQSPWRFFGTAGNDRISGLLKVDAQVHGAGGNDQLGVSGSTEDFPDDQFAHVSLFGDAGNDSITASGEDVFVAYGDGGAGDDSYEVYNSHSFSGPFADTGGGMDALSIYLIGDGPNERITVPDGIEKCYAGGFGYQSIELTGNSQDNVLTVEADFATIRGGAGNDTIYGTDGDDALFGDGGNDEIHAGGGNDTLTGAAGRDKLFGDAGDDLFQATDGRTDTLDGGIGADRAHRDHGPAIFDQLTSIETLL